MDARAPDVVVLVIHRWCSLVFQAGSDDYAHVVTRLEAMVALRCAGCGNL
jgi:hypothetical protein